MDDISKIYKLTIDQVKLLFEWDKSSKTLKVATDKHNEIDAKLRKITKMIERLEKKVGCK